MQCNTIQYNTAAMFLVDKYSIIFLLIIKFASHRTSTCIVSTSNKPLVGSLITIGAGRNEKHRYTIQYNTIQYNTIQYNTIQYNTIQYNTIQYNTIQYNTIQYNTIQYNLLVTP